MAGNTLRRSFNSYPAKALALAAASAAIFFAGRASDGSEQAGRAIAEIPNLPEKKQEKPKPKAEKPAFTPLSEFKQVKDGNFKDADLFGAAERIKRGWGNFRRGRIFDVYYAAPVPAYFERDGAAYEIELEYKPGTRYLFSALKDLPAATRMGDAYIFSEGQRQDLKMEISFKTDKNGVDTESSRAYFFLPEGTDTPPAFSPEEYPEAADFGQQFGASREGPRAYSIPSP